ncbi:Ets-domain [Popillia japonica]|uniref:Ets-domain n=1 Tax=Popillia japonica TaxID=7064 RepID=A0AAW1JVR4_POPJA
MFKNIFLEEFSPDYYNAVYTETLDQIYNVDINLQCHWETANKYAKIADDREYIPNICEVENDTRILDNTHKFGGKGTNPGIVNFVVELLHNPDTNPSMIKWEDYDKGKFRFTNPEKVSKLWGRRNSRAKEKEMDFGKFSRAIRYHYGQGNFIAVPEQKLKMTIAF